MSVCHAQRRLTVAGLEPRQRKKCDSGLEKDGALCHNRCRSGFKGVWPVCWASGCPAGMIDTGVACAKKTEPRGAGTVPGTCTSSSFVRSPAPSVTMERSFDMIIANDPQVVWWQVKTNGAVCGGNKDCQKNNAEKESLYQVRAMNNIGALGTRPGTNRKTLGVIINGDLNSFFHTWEFDLFEMYYVKGSDAPHKDVVQYPVYNSLGNHNYAINVNNCFWIREPRYGVLLKNGCAQKAVDYMKAMISCGRIETFPAIKIESYDSGSLAYSWNMGSYRFVQLHNYPTYKVPSLGVKPSMAWLKKDSDRAKTAHKKIVVNMHDLDDHIKTKNLKAFEALLAKYNVVDIFCGHVIDDE